MSEHTVPTVLDQIHVLPDDLSNQIAAGEVVERPASVVRELVENSLDAGATRIDIELLDGGAQLIRISDDGHGMTPTDAERAIQRHATSKISTREDLFNIASYGFRGEALPSIASVSKFELITRTKDTWEATRVLVEGGSVKLVEPWSAPVGTTITIRDLFYNTPARRKFLKTKNTEQRHAIRAIEEIALPRPDVGFTLKVGDRTVVNLPAVENIWQRIAAVEGYDKSKHLFPAPPEHQDGVTAWGFVAEPKYTTRHASGMRIFVNGRAIRDRMLIGAVRRGYETLVDRGRSPVVYMFVSVPLTDIDVNVHPAKAEVRFRTPDAVFRALRRSVKNALIDAPWVEGNLKVRSEDAQNVWKYPKRTGPDAVHQSVDPLAQEDLSLWSQVPTRRYQLNPREPVEFHSGEGERAFPSSNFVADASSTAPALETEGSVTIAPAGAEDAGIPTSGWFQSLHYIGVLHRLYLLLSGADGLVVIDQHAAHERITYEHLRNTWRKRSVNIQQSIVPDMISLNSQRALTLHDHLEFFQTLGFVMEHFEGNDFALRGTPDWFGQRNFSAMLTDALDDLADEGTTAQVETARDALLSRMACHGSIRAGDQVSPAEVRQLLADLDQVDFGANCPHGRPVYLPITLEELEVRFERR